MALGENRTEMLDFSTDDGLGQRARIGLIVLQTDQTIEHEFATLLRGDGGGSLSRAHP
jgi:maleate isomerase